MLHVWKSVLNKGQLMDDFSTKDNGFSVRMGLLLLFWIAGVADDVFGCI